LLEKRIKMTTRGITNLWTPILYELVNKILFHMCFNPNYINRNLVSKDKTKANIIQEQRYRIYITKFRLCNIRIPIETGRWQKITRENRKCTKCSKDVIGDEYHYLFIWIHTYEIRQRHNNNINIGEKNTIVNRSDHSNI
jgi:hypothetical protein